MLKKRKLGEKEVMEAFNIYKKQVPDMGIVTLEQADELLEKGKICRGLINHDNELEYFHIVKSPTSFPEKTLFSAGSGSNLFFMLIAMGKEKGIDLDDMLSDD